MLVAVVHVIAQTTPLGGSALSSFLLVSMLASVVYTGINFVANALNKQHSAYLKQAGAWLLGIAAAFAVGASQLAQQVQLGTFTLQSLSGISKAILGVLVASVAGTLYHLFQRLDTHDPGSVVPPVTTKTAPVVPPAGAPRRQ